MLKIMAMALSLLAITGCGGAHMASNQGVVFIGDSITAFWAETENGQQAAWAENGWTNLGVPGNTSAQILTRFTTEIPTRRPKIVHILAGTNDMGAGWKLSDTSDNIKQMVAIARASGSTVILGTVPPWGTGWAAWAQDPVDRWPRIEKYNDWIKSYGAAEGIQVIDYHQALEDAYTPGVYKGSPLFSFDGVHPSPAGYAIMTPLVEAALKQ